MIYTIKKNPALFFFFLVALLLVAMFITNIYSNTKANADEDVVEENLREEIEILKEENWKLKDANWSLSDALNKMDAELKELKLDAGE